MRDYSTGAQLLEKIVATDPNYKNAWNYLGWTYNALGQYEKAEAALRKAIAVNPQDPSAYNNLGQALSYQKKYDEAIPQYQKQIEINPKDQWAHANLGRVYLLNKQYDKATRHHGMRPKNLCADPEINSSAAADAGSAFRPLPVPPTSCSRKSSHVVWVR